MNEYVGGDDMSILRPLLAETGAPKLGSMVIVLPWHDPVLWPPAGRAPHQLQGPGRVCGAWRHRQR